MTKENDSPEITGRAFFGKYELDEGYINFLRESAITEEDFQSINPCEKAKLRREYATFQREEYALTDSACTDCKVVLQHHPEACGTSCVKLNEEDVSPETSTENPYTDGKNLDCWPGIGEIVTIASPGQQLKVAGWLTAVKGDRVCVTHKELDKEGRDEVWLYGYKVSYGDSAVHCNDEPKEEYKGWFSRSLVNFNKKEKRNGGSERATKDQRGIQGSDDTVAQEL